jgi:hypothetical protein
VFVGMPDERIERQGDGAVYVYARKDGQDGVFAFEQRIVASDPLPFATIPKEQCTDGALECGELSGRGFGAGLAVDVQTLIVGADRSEGSPAELYVFERDGAHSSELGKLRVHYEGAGNSLRAMPLVLLDQRALLGSPHTNVRAGWWAGSAELLPLTPTAGDSLTLGSELHTLDPSADAGFGNALARMGDDLLVGAPGEHGGQVIAVPMHCASNVTP